MSVTDVRQRNVSELLHSDSVVKGEVSDEGIDSNDPSRKRNAVCSLRICLFCFWLYFTAYTLVIPAFPSLLLEATNGRNNAASSYFGAATSIRYILEFFSCPFWGNLSDSVGRKKILIMSLVTMFVEYSLLAVFPKVWTVFAVSIMSGFGNAGMAMGYVIVTDIAYASGEPLTNNFGYFAAISGMGFVLGPLCGSLLISVNLRLCFLVAAAISCASLLTIVFFLEETCVIMRSYDPAKSSPTYSLRVFFENRNLRRLSVTYMLSNVCSGLYFIWVLYMTQRFKADIKQIGVFLSVSGTCAVLVQGVLVPFLVPTYLDDENGLLLGLALFTAQLLAYGVCPTLPLFFVVLVLFSPALMCGPTLKTLFAKAAGPDEQGALQGALGSLRTGTAGIGSLLFTGIFSLSITVTHPKIAGLPFYFAAFITFISYFHTRRTLAVIAKEELEGGSDDVVRLLEESSGLLSGRGLRGLYSYNSSSSYSGEDQYLIRAISTNTAVTSNTSSSSVGNASATAADVGHKPNDIPAVSHGIESFNSTDSHYENQNQNENESTNENSFHAESTTLT